MEGLTSWDYILLPIYLLILSAFARRIRLKYKDNPKLTLYFKLAFRIKIIAVIAFTLLTAYVMRGDNVDLYFGEGKNFANLVKKDFSKVYLIFMKANDETDDLASPDEKGYLKIESNYSVVKVSIVLCLLGFSKLMIVNLLCAFIAFMGSWSLFLFFRSQKPDLEKQFAIICMGIPSVVFWSSGIGKDALCIASLGFLTLSLYKVIITKQKIFLNLCITHILY